jgi:membrane-anchored glycerophosphoryl diester phosphodiesterase (GDPDase)
MKLSISEWNKDQQNVKYLLWSIIVIGLRKLHANNILVSISLTPTQLNQVLTEREGLEMVAALLNFNAVPFVDAINCHKTLYAVFSILLIDIQTVIERF